MREYASVITARLGLRTYGEPIVHRTGGQAAMKRLRAVAAET